MCLQVENVTQEAEHMEAEDKVSVCRAEVMAAAFLFQHMWGWDPSSTSGSGLGKIAHTLCAVHSYYGGR